jgi:hypothetical protein
VPFIVRAIQTGAVDFMVVEGVRSDEQAFANFGKGRRPNSAAPSVARSFTPCRS